MEIARKGLVNNIGMGVAIIGLARVLKSRKTELPSHHSSERVARSCVFWVRDFAHILEQLKPLSSAGIRRASITEHDRSFTSKIQTPEVKDDVRARRCIRMYVAINPRKEIATPHKHAQFPLLSTVSAAIRCFYVAAQHIWFRSSFFLPPAALLCCPRRLKAASCKWRCSNQGVIAKIVPPLL